jgi:hypothetical protein
MRAVNTEQASQTMGPTAQPQSSKKSSSSARPDRDEHRLHDQRLPEEPGVQGRGY